MLKEMWATLPKDSMLDTGTGSKFYREMWLEEISKRMSHVGSGLGIASVVKRELMDRARREITPAQLSNS
jgi:Rod binding domain-containing protein